ncbi:Tap42 interacting protein [Linderina macrospora]|uniref:Tap42 interacting protein n=1 Tax=Linderina macrospora TaxID=4868 RepID=A0ACC1JCF3_9FUNG|nr:Tap42 interacting protein [Linderina macrospora]
MTTIEKIETPTEGGLRLHGNKEIEHHSQELGFNVPEMIFGNNYLRLTHLATGKAIELRALDALRLVDVSEDSAKSVQVSIAGNWSEAQKRKDITDVIKPFDWTYTTRYTGTLANGLVFQTGGSGIDYEKLKVREEILFFDENVLYEDDLGDNGTSQLAYKVRVMPSGFFVLQRFFLRVDGVVFRIFDTRIYHEFGTDLVVRETSERECSFDEVKRKVPKKKHDDEDLSLLNNIPFVDSVMLGARVECATASLH